MLVNDYLVLEREQPDGIGGMQRIYRIGNYGLSLVNTSCIHDFPFAWEAAIIRFKDKNIDDFALIYTTPLTNDVEVFSTDKEANKFLKKAFRWFQKQEEAHDEHNGDNPGRD